MRKLGRLCGVLAVAALLAVSCSDDDDADGDPAPDDTNGADVDDTTDAGDTSDADDPSDGDDSSGADDDSDDSSEPTDSGDSTDSGLPIPLPAGGEVTLSTASDRIVEYPADQFDSLVAFYDDWTSNEAEDYVREELANGTITWDNQADAIENTRGIIVAPDVGGKASVTLVAGPG